MSSRPFYLLKAGITWLKAWRGVAEATFASDGLGFQSHEMLHDCCTQCGRRELVFMKIFSSFLVEQDLIWPSRRWPCLTLTSVATDRVPRGRILSCPCQYAPTTITRGNRKEVRWTIQKAHWMNVHPFECHHVVALPAILELVTLEVLAFIINDGVTLLSEKYHGPWVWQVRL